MIARLKTWLLGVECYASTRRHIWSSWTLGESYYGRTSQQRTCELCGFVEKREL